MRLIKTLVLAVLTAMLAAVFFGAVSASATSTALCKVHKEPCTEGNWVNNIHLLNKGNIVFKAKFLVTVTIECKKSAAELSVQSLGSPQTSIVSSVTWAECSTGGTICSVQMVNLGFLHTLKTALNLGYAEAVGPSIRVVCGSIFNCEYTANEKKVTLEGSGHSFGSGNGMFTAKELPLDKVAGGFTCPNTTTITALYELLEATFVVS